MGVPKFPLQAVNSCSIGEVLSLGFTVFICNVISASAQLQSEGYQRLLQWFLETQRFLLRSKAVIPSKCLPKSRHV